MVNGTPEGLCICTLVREGIHGFRGWVFGQVFDLMFGKMEYCGRLLPGIALRPELEELPLELVRGLEELCVIHKRCSCDVTSSEKLMYY